MGSEPELNGPSFFYLQTQTGWGKTLEAFAAWGNPQPGWLTLDVGCGPGLLPALYAQRGCRAYGVDIDPAAFRPQALHQDLAAADVFALPFSSGIFDQVTASNLLFLLGNPAAAFQEIARLLSPSGQAVLLNPSERLTVQAASQLAESRGLLGEARQSILQWAGRAERHYRWTEADLAGLFRFAGLELVESALRIGPGLARFARAVRRPGRF